MTQMNAYGLIGLTEENVGVDRRFYTGLTSTNGTFAVSYNAGRVDVFLNGIKLIGNHTGNANYDYTMDSTTGTGSTITLATGVALVSADVIECVGYVSNSSNTVTSYNPTPASGGGWNVFSSISHTASDLVNVFLNGVLLDDSDYTLDASANTVTIGGDTLTASDVVVIQVIGALDHSNFVPVSGGDFTGNVTTTGEIHTDDIKEKTSAHGVEIDGLTVKDAGLALGSDADGDIYYRASGALARLAKGAGSTVLKMNSGGTAPEWGTESGGAWTLIKRTAISGSPTEVVFVDGTGGVVIDSSTYSVYKIIGQNLGSTTDITNLGMQIRTSAGYDSGNTNYKYSGTQNIKGGNESTGSHSSRYQGAANFISLGFVGASNVAHERNHTFEIILTLQTDVVPTVVGYSTAIGDAGNQDLFSVSGALKINTHRGDDIDGFRFFFHGSYNGASAGTFLPFANQGSISVLGLKTS